MAKRKQKGNVVRMGYDVHEALRRRKKKGESWNKFFRRVFCLPGRDGKEPERRSYWLLESTKVLFASEKEARGHAILVAVGKGKRKAETPIKVSEEL